MFPARLLWLMVPLLVASCQSEVGFADARTRTQSRATFSRSQVEERLTTLRFPMTRAELAEYFPAVGFGKDPCVLLESASSRPKGTEYCRLGDGLLLVMPVDYKNSVSRRPYSNDGAASISALEVHTDAGDVVKGAVLAANRGVSCPSCSNAAFMKMLNAGL